MSERIEPASRENAATSSKPNPSFESQVADLLGPKGFTRDAAAVDPWLTDWRGRYTGRAVGLASPASTQEVSALLQLCAKEGVPVVPQGGNSGMVGGATPDKTGNALLLSLRRMDDVTIDPQAKQAICEAGVILQNLHEAAAGEELRFPLSLGGKGSATVGGLVSTNAGGTQVLRHGVMRALVEGLEIVLPDGTVLDLTSPLKKDNRGFDLKQLFIGSEGTLGIVTKAVLALVPAIAARQVVWVGLDSLEAARELLLHCERSMGQALEGFEVLPDSCYRTVLAYLDARPPLEGTHAWHALLEFDADREGAATLPARVEACLADALERGLFEDAAIASNEKQAETFWQLREMIAVAERAHGRAVQHDISVAPALMPATLGELERAIVEQFPDHEVRGFGHLGDGNIHLHVLAPAEAPNNWDDTTAKQISDLVYRHVSEKGGSISAEHGIGQDKLSTLEATRDPAALSLMRSIKRAVDPHGLMNPGKLVQPK
ncbi:FAD-binding protein [Altererythrobacter aurantiacus]|uniref:FAD-binding protein n=1 Tax=Parapontixanthobacter aurantiacus TaxID=1463599 RepID=A0A844ZE56_9SPHN|nr:FAD-binding oxidoreductase [Parapontixanthobacter aurantiacus]MXO85532.1 FAD-binding protein [Parapontixanthobacter aurantiacus]